MIYVMTFPFPITCVKFCIFVGYMAQHSAKVDVNEYVFLKLWKQMVKAA